MGDGGSHEAIIPTLISWQVLFSRTKIFKGRGNVGPEKFK